MAGSIPCGSNTPDTAVAGPAWLECRSLLASEPMLWSVNERPLRLQAGSYKQEKRPWAWCEESLKAGFGMHCPSHGQRLLSPVEFMLRLRSNWKGPDISPLETGRGLIKVSDVTTVVANAIARMTKRQKLALAGRLLVEAKAKPSSVRTSRAGKAGRSQFVRSKITGQIVTRGAKGAPRVTSEQVRALLVDFP